MGTYSEELISRIAEIRPFGDTPFAKTGYPRNFVVFAAKRFFSDD